MKHYESVEFLSNLNVQPPCTNVKPPRTNVKPPIDDFLATVLPRKEILILESFVTVTAGQEYLKWHASVAFAMDVPGESLTIVAPSPIMPPLPPQLWQNATTRDYSKFCCCSVNQWSSNHVSVEGAVSWGFGIYKYLAKSQKTGQRSLKKFW